MKIISFYCIVDEPIKNTILCVLNIASDAKEDNLRKYFDGATSIVVPRDRLGGCKGLVFFFSKHNVYCFFGQFIFRNLFSLLITISILINFCIVMP